MLKTMERHQLFAYELFRRSILFEQQQQQPNSFIGLWLCVKRMLFIAC